MNEVDTFAREVAENVRGMKADDDLQAFSRMWARAVARYRYAYNFRWLGRPIIQVPQDIVAMQELVFSIKPSVIVETGVAHGGSLTLNASLLELIGGDSVVIGIDVDIRAHNREALDAHPLRKRMHLIEGSSTDKDVVSEVFRIVKEKSSVPGAGPVLVSLDSNHTHEHVLAELRAYAPLVTRGSYIVVFDTLIDDLPADLFEGKGWGPGNNPKTAVRAFLKECPRFAVDSDIDAKLLITVAPGGWLVCTRDPEGESDTTGAV
jgi:cephalosporin hydroxylase